ncbi:MAG: FAD-dependent oxidoreductase [Pseudoflavonifractor sp.]
MKQKLLSLVLAAGMLFSMAGCSKPAPKATGTPAPAPAPTAPVAATNEKYDIVILGGGGAGLAAAVEAKQQGAENILVLEKMSFLGGATTMAFGGFNCAKSEFMTAQERVEENIQLLDRCMKNGKNLNDLAATAVVIEETPKVIEWMKSFGSEWGQIRYTDLHCPTDGTIPGVELIKVLSEQAKKLGVEIRLNTSATEIITDADGRVTGVAATGPNGSYTIDCTAAILATGGYGHNQEMIAKDHPDLANIHLPSAQGSDGDGIKMATALGAKTRNMDLIQLSCAVAPFSIQMQLPHKNNGVIFVNKEGKRFTNEFSEASSDRRISADILAQTDGECFGVYSDKIYKDFMATENMDFFDEYRITGIDKSGLVVKADTVEQLAEKLGVPAAALKTTLEGLGGTDAFENEKVPPVASTYKTGPYYAVPLTPGVMDTLGGIEIDSSGRVIKEDGKHIPGLYAGGEVIGNIQGAYYSIGLGEAAVFGRVSARNAIAYVIDRGGLTAYVAPAGDNVQAGPAAKGNFTDGTYTGSAKGNNGDIKVEVVVKDSSITAVNVLEHVETPNIFPGVLDSFIPNLIHTQDLEVDAVAGATYSSEGVRAAVKAALGK